MIDGVITFPDGREVCAMNSAKGRMSYVHRTDSMAYRQGNQCPMCKGAFWSSIGSPTFDHQDGRGGNSGHRDDRLLRNGEWYNAALCHKCNGEKGSIRYHWQNGLYVPCKAGEQTEGDKDA